MVNYKDYQMKVDDLLEKAELLKKDLYLAEKEIAEKIEIINRLLEKVSQYEKK